MGDHLDIFRCYYLSYYLEPRSGPGVGKQLQPFFSESLEIIRRSPGFVRPAAKDLGSGAAYSFGSLHQLIVALDRAWSSHYHELRSPNLEVSDFYNGMPGLQLATH